MRKAIGQFQQWYESTVTERYRVSTPQVKITELPRGWYVLTLTGGLFLKQYTVTILTLFHQSCDNTDADISIQLRLGVLIYAHLYRWRDCEYTVDVHIHYRFVCTCMCMYICMYMYVHVCICMYAVVTTSIPTCTKYSVYM